MLTLTHREEILLGKVYADRDGLPFSLADNPKLWLSAGRLAGLGLVSVSQRCDDVQIESVLPDGVRHVEHSRGVLAKNGFAILSNTADEVLRRLAYVTYIAKDIGEKPALTPDNAFDGSYYELQRNGLIDLISADNEVYAIMQVTDRGMTYATKDVLDIDGFLEKAEVASNLCLNDCDNANIDNVTSISSANQSSGMSAPTVPVDSTLSSRREWCLDYGKSDAITSRRKVVFISHSIEDREIVEAFVRLLRNMGLDESNLFCSSCPGFGIPLSKNIFDFLKHCFDDYEMFVIFMISKNHYYSSAACLNEMGAAWICGAECASILLPGMSTGDMRGAISAERIAVVLDDVGAKHRLNELRDNVADFLGLGVPSESIWESDRDRFLEQIKASR